MARPTMVILRGNKADVDGGYPDERGKVIAWPVGALHVQPAIDFARRLGYDATVLDVPGNHASDTSPQTTAALAAFHADETVTAFYGFSGGGYNLWHILNRLATDEPESLHRIDRVVALGSPNTKFGGKRLYEPHRYNDIARKQVKEWKDADWKVIYRLDPESRQLPKGLPKDTPPHMFGPEVLLATWTDGT